MSKRIEYIIDDIKEQYLEKDNNIPWIIGFSGGKDSTVVLTWYGGRCSLYERSRGIMP